MRGPILLDGEPLAPAHPADLVAQRHGAGARGPSLLQALTVEENLLTGAIARRIGRRAARAELEQVYASSPPEGEAAHRAGLTSGGEQQMTAIGRALMGKPRLILLDEPSMGLAPLIVEDIFMTLRDLNRREGLTLLLAEQNAATALRYAHRAYVLENGGDHPGRPGRRAEAAEGHPRALLRPRPRRRGRLPHPGRSCPAELAPLTATAQARSSA